MLIYVKSEQIIKVINNNIHSNEKKYKNIIKRNKLGFPHALTLFPYITNISYTISYIIGYSVGNIVFTVKSNALSTVITGYH